MKAKLSLMLSAAALVCTLSPKAMALDWTNADSLYAQRENNRDAIAKARSAYLDILSQATATPDKIRAVEQLGRLAIYEGEMLMPKNDAADRTAIFSECWCKQTRAISRSCATPGFVDAISPANIGEETQAYYYFHGVCLAYWGEQASVVNQLAFIGTLQSDVQKGEGFSPSNYEGGGIHRLAAGVWSNPAARPLGMYDPDKALTEAEAALDAPAYGDQSPGSLYFDNYKGKVVVMRELNSKYPGQGWNDKAIAFANDSLGDMQDKIDGHKVPADRVAEFDFIFGSLKQHYKELTGKDWNPN